MSTTQTHQGRNNEIPPENDGPTAETSNISNKRKKNKNKQKKQNAGNGNSDSGKKFEGGKTSGALKGKTLSDATRLIDEFKDIHKALILQATVDDNQPEWGDAFKELKRPNLQEVFKRKDMDPVRDGWGEIIESPMRDEHNNIVKDKSGNEIINRVVKENDPQLKLNLETEYRYYNKFVDEKKNSHIAYEKIAIVMTVGQIAPTVESTMQLSDAYKAAIKKNDVIDLLCAIRDVCYNAGSIGSEPLLESLRVLRVMLSFKQKPNGDIGPFAEKLQSRAKNVVKRLGDCPFGKNLMEAVINKKFPHYNIHDYDCVGLHITPLFPNANGNLEQVLITKMSQEEKEECDDSYVEIALSRLLVLNNKKEHVRTYLHNLYLNSKADYPNTVASTLLQITSIKRENNNQKDEAHVNVHAVDHVGNNDTNNTLINETHSEVPSEEPNEENDESELTMEEIIAAAAASTTDGVEDIDPEELDFMEEEPERAELVCGMVADEEESMDYDSYISEEESYDYSSDEDSIPDLISREFEDSSSDEDSLPDLIDREFEDSSSDEEDSTTSVYPEHYQHVPQPILNNNRDVVIRGETLQRYRETLSVSADAEFGTGANSNVANPNEPQQGPIRSHQYFRNYFGLSDPPRSFLYQEVNREFFRLGER